MRLIAASPKHVRVSHMFASFLRPSSIDVPTVISLPFPFFVYVWQMGYLADVTNSTPCCFPACVTPTISSMEADKIRETLVNRAGMKAALLLVTGVIVTQDFHVFLGMPLRQATLVAGLGLAFFLLSAYLSLIHACT